MTVCCREQAEGQEGESEEPTPEEEEEPKEMTLDEYKAMQSLVSTSLHRSNSVLHLKVVLSNLFSLCRIASISESAWCILGVYIRVFTVCM